MGEGKGEKKRFNFLCLKHDRPYCTSYLITEVSTGFRNQQLVQNYNYGLNTVILYMYIPVSFHSEHYYAVEKSTVRYTS